MVLSVGSDYTALSPEPSELFFLPVHYDQYRTVTIPIINNNVHEQMEQFTVQLSLPSGSTGVVLNQDSATVQIVDEDRECPGVMCVVSISHCVLPHLSRSEHPVGGHCIHSQ